MKISRYIGMEGNMGEGVTMRMKGEERDGYGYGDADADADAEVVQECIAYHRTGYQVPRSVGSKGMWNEWSNE